MKKNISKVLIIFLAIIFCIIVFSSCGDSGEKMPLNGTENSSDVITTYEFRYDDMLRQHYDKHGKEMGFASAEEYQAAANLVISNPKALTKTEKQDGDTVYYLEDTNEFVVLSEDGYIRTYFLPEDGINYFNRQ